MQKPANPSFREQIEPDETPQTPFHGVLTDRQFSKQNSSWRKHRPSLNLKELDRFRRFKSRIQGRLRRCPSGRPHLFHPRIARVERGCAGVRITLCKRDAGPSRHRRPNRMRQDAPPRCHRGTGAAARKPSRTVQLPPLSPGRRAI